MLQKNLKTDQSVSRIAKGKIGTSKKSDGKITSSKNEEEKVSKTSKLQKIKEPTSKFLKNVGTPILVHAGKKMIDAAGDIFTEKVIGPRESQGPRKGPSRSGEFSTVNKAQTTKTKDGGRKSIYSGDSGAVPKNRPVVGVCRLK